MAVIEVIGGELFQWDTGRKLKISLSNEISVERVDYESRSLDAVISVEVKQEDGRIIADIPNILLQSTNKIIAYVVIKESESERTISARNLFIVPRAKPVDYVYTETEVLSYETLERRVTDKIEELDSVESDMERAEEIRVENENTRIEQEESRQASMKLILAQKDAIETTGAAQIDAVKTTGTSQIDAVKTTGTSQIDAVKAEGAAQLAKIEEKVNNLPLPSNPSNSNSKVLWSGVYNGSGLISFFIPEKCFHNNGKNLTLVIEATKTNLTSYESGTAPGDNTSIISLTLPTDSYGDSNRADPFALFDPYYSRYSSYAYTATDRMFVGSPVGVDIEIQILNTVDYACCIMKNTYGNYAFHESCITCIYALVPNNL